MMASAREVAAARYATQPRGDGRWIARGGILRPGAGVLTCISVVVPTPSSKDFEAKTIVKMRVRLYGSPDYAAAMAKWGAQELAATTVV